MRVALLTLMMALLGAMMLPGQALDLTEAQISALPEEARVSYQAAQAAFGQRAQVQGLGHLIHANRAAPQSAPLNLALARVAGIMGNQPDQERADQLFALARAAAERAANSEAATEEQKAEAQRLLAQFGADSLRVEQLTANQASREALRAEMQARMAESHSGESESQENSHTETDPERNANGTPRYDGSVRYMQGIQDARDIQQGTPR